MNRESFMHSKVLMLEITPVVGIFDNDEGNCFDMIKLPPITVYKGRGFNLDATCKDAEKIALEYYKEKNQDDGS